LRTIVCSGVAALALLLGAAAAVPAAAGTAALNRPAAASPVADELLSVSCPAAKQCLAVGVNHDGFSGAGGPLAEIWNGRTWDTIAVRLPAGATAGSLTGVDCLSARDCVAVGFYDTDSAYPYTQFALADTWNGRTWTPATLPAPDSQFTSLSGVSCGSARRCVAVGTYTRSSFQAPLAEIWNGRTWTRATPPIVGGNGSGLVAVSCAAATSCVTTGWGLGGTMSMWMIDSWNGRSLLDSWNGGSWWLTAYGFNSGLASVSCTSPDTCAAVGSMYGPEPPGSLTELWNGNSWSAPAVSWPTGTSWPALLGVSCAAANRCVAVGTTGPDTYVGDGTNTGRAAAQTWNGKAWTAVSVPAPGTGEASVFNAVTCLTATDCVAVGQAGPAGTANGAGLSGFWNGKSWRLVTAQ
jgi:hypothetical protein